MHQLTNEQIDAIKNRKSCLLDVRSHAEYENEKSQYALNKDVHDIAAGASLNVPKNMPVYVFCRSGNRSELAKHLLESRGFESVANVGGYKDLPLELR